MKPSIIAAALVGIALVSSESSAQVSTVAKPVQFGIAAGAALPTSDLSDAASTGFNVTGTIGITPQLIPLGIRIDGAYNRFSLKTGVWRRGWKRHIRTPSGMAEQTRSAC